MSNLPTPDNTFEQIDRELEKKKQQRRERVPNEVFDFVELIAITLAVLLFITLFFCRQSIVSGNSMQNTLQNGEHLLISDFLYTPKPGDIVVVQATDAISERFPNIGRHESVVKRVIATEGQRVRGVNGRIYVDGEPVAESYLHNDNCRPDRYASFPEVTVSEGCIFILGDHRDNSLDSRYFGEVPVQTVVGKVLLRIFPFDRFGGVN